jgi:CBS domain-containing protein
MRVGVVTCRPETKLADVARIMDGYGIQPAGMISARGIAAALAYGHS